MFLGSEYLEAHSLAVRQEDYNKVYHDSLPEEMTLDGIYEKFNLFRPDDFEGHSLSVGDVVVMSRAGAGKAFFVDTVGFKELPGFIPPARIKQKTKDVKINHITKEYGKEAVVCR